MTTRPMEELARSALDHVARECPPAYEAMRGILRDRRISVRIRGESFELALAEGPTRPAISVWTSAKALRDLLRGERDALDAILGGEVLVRGDALDLVAAVDAGLCFVKGAARCASLETLLSRLEHLADEEDSIAAPWS